MITQQYIKSILHYDPETGIFTWLSNKLGKGNSTGKGTLGCVAGTKHHAGYIVLGIDNKKHLSAHRLAFLYMVGKIPNVVDHINNDKSDNRWCNLREADNFKNRQNIGKRKNNSSGYKGVSYCKEQNKWMASLGYTNNDGKRCHKKIGRFYTPEEAHQAYCKAAKELHGEFFNPG